MTFRNLPRQVRLLAFSVSLNVAVFTALRAAFWRVFDTPLDPMSGAVTLEAFFIGFKFDLRLALILNLPVFALSWLGPVNPYETRLGRRLWTGYLAATNLIVLLFYLVDFGHYAYLQSRLNVTAVRFLYNPLISLQMVWETYHVVWGLLGLAIFAAGFSYAVGRVVRRLARAEAPPLARWEKTAALSITVFLSLFGLYGKASHYPLRWSDAFFSTHPFSSALASNPVLFFFDTLKNRGSRYDAEEVRRNYGLLARYLGVDEPDGQKLDFSRHISAADNPGARPNVVIVLLESYTFHKSGVFGNPLDPTPNFDAVARDSLLFKRFYVPSSGTARSVFALVTGIPDVETAETSTRNPLVVSQHTIVNAFSGYEKFYFLGGSANWANIRGLLSHNVPGLRIYEEGSYDLPRTDVWGISDLQLFEEANRVLGKAQEPFFAIVHTSGNHRPYTIPDDNRGFKTVDADEDEVKRYGFISVKEYNSFRFMDHSLGIFMDAARKEEYFSNTIFVFLGDHGLPGTAEHMQEAEEKLQLTRYHVPLVIYAPGLIREPRVFDAVASEVDVLPTIAGLAGVPYRNTTLGRDLLDGRFDDMRYAFTVANQSTMPEVGLISRDFYFVMNSDGSNKRLHDYHSPTPRDNVLQRHPDIAAMMERLTRALFEASKYMPYFNPAEPEAPAGMEDSSLMEDGPAPPVTREQSNPG